MSGQVGPSAFRTTFLVLALSCQVSPVPTDPAWLAMGLTGPGLRDPAPAGAHNTGPDLGQRFMSPLMGCGQRDILSSRVRQVRCVSCGFISRWSRLGGRCDAMEGAAKRRVGRGKRPVCSRSWTVWSRFPRPGSIERANGGGEGVTPRTAERGVAFSLVSSRSQPSSQPQLSPHPETTSTPSITLLFLSPTPPSPYPTLAFDPPRHPLQLAQPIAASSKLSPRSFLRPLCPSRPPCLHPRQSLASATTAMSLPPLPPLDT